MPKFAMQLFAALFIKAYCKSKYVFILCIMPDNAAAGNIFLQLVGVLERFSGLSRNMKKIGLKRIVSTFSKTHIVLNL